MKSDHQQPTIQLNGVATREMTNDVLSLTFTHNKQGKDANEVQENLREAVRDALAIIQPNLKPGEVDVKTDAFRVEPNYEYKNGGKQKMIGYEGTAGLTVKGTDTATISRIASEITSMIISSSSNSVSRKVRESVEAELTQEAIKDFRSKADAAAVGFDVKSWKVGDISIRTQAERPVGGKMMAMAANLGGAMESAPMPVEGGKSEISVYVAGTIVLKD